jgi:hypothetical protein
MSKAQSLIEQFYQEEQARQAEEATFTPLDISISSADMAIVNTISKRFNKDKGLLVREALTQAFIDMFSALEPVERKLLAKEADEQAKSIAAEIAEEQGLDHLEVSGTNWVAQDKACVKAERQAAKEAEKQKASMSDTPATEEAHPSIEAETSMESEPANEEMATESEAPFAAETSSESENNSIFA